jgi:hypothetical protein
MHIPIHWGCTNIHIVIRISKYTETQIFLVALYEFETWSHTSYEYNLRVLKNRIRRTVFRSKRDKRGNARVKVVLRHVRVTTVAVEKQKVLHILSVCVRNLGYSASSANPLCYSFICGLSGYTTFFHIIS